MNIIFIGKFPPIQGGVSASSLTLVRDLDQLGHKVFVLTNANEVEQGFKQNLSSGDWLDVKEYAGSGVEVVSSEPEQNLLHIPFSKCYFEKLSGLGVEILEKNNIDLIISWYFQPYLLVASYLSNIFGVPYVANHAGSDLGRLAKEPAFKKLYSRALKGCDYIFTRRNSIELLKDTFPNIPESKLKIIRRGNRLPKLFNNKAKPLLFKTEIVNARGIYESKVFYKNIASKINAINSDYPKDNLPTIGMYGKLGESKGSFAVLASLSALLSKGLEFNFVYVAGGTQPTFNDFVEKLNCFPELKKNTWIIPYISYLKVPSLIKAFDISLFLENGFSIEIHNPTVPFEILAVGSCLVTTSEITKKSVLDTLLVDSINYLCVSNPNNTEELADVIEYALKDERYRLIGAHGRSVHTVVQGDKLQHHPIAIEIDKIYNKSSQKDASKAGASA